MTPPADSEPVTWARPLPRSEHRTRLVECFVGMDYDGDWFTAHVMFVRKVLREPWSEAFAIARRFRRNPLTVEAAELLADEWYQSPACARPGGRCDLARPHPEDCRSDRRRRA